MKKFIAILLIFGLGVIGTCAGGPTQVVGEMTRGAESLLASLSPQQDADANFSFTEEERLNWHFIPRERKGLPIKTMSQEQRKLAHALLGTGLSSEGHSKARDIIFLEEILYHQENRNPTRDPDAYFFSFFGRPGESGEWGWRMEGHHLSLNFTLQKGRVISATPAFFGANPAEVREGPRKGFRVLAAEEDLARQLLGLFTGDFRKKVLIDVEAPADIITGSSRKAELSPLVGVSRAEMTPEQDRLLMELVHVYANRFRPELAQDHLDEILAGGGKGLHFAWAGGSERGQPHYYRIHGQTFVIEYDNTQNNANHIHTVWRDFDGDFGLDLLGEHHARSHPPGGG